MRKKPDRQPTTVEIQLELIVRAFRAKGAEIDIAYTPAGDLDFLYQKGTILVRDAYLGQVSELVGGGERLDGLVDGVTLLSLAKSKARDAPDALARIDAALGVGVATPNHVLSICPVSACPATEPEESPGDRRPDPGVCEPAGRGVLIYAPDTGLLADAGAHPWLAGVTGDPDPLADVGGSAEIHEYAGHGTFIAGVARCMASDSAVHVAGDFSTAGALFEDQVVKRLDEALGLGPDIISLSAGTTTRKDIPLLSFEAFWHRYRQYKGTALVAAAGNNDARRPFWPAAFPEVVSVGAVAANWRSRARFSDFGPWVDVYAPGEDLVNAFATGTYICREPPNTGQRREFDGMARWSGTSFATPLVAGLIAARVSKTGENARQAADALLSLARCQSLPGIGPVLWPCQAGEGCCGRLGRAGRPGQPGCGGRPGCGGQAGCGCRSGDGGHSGCGCGDHGGWWCRGGQ